jgi:hypothetical protein
VTPHQKLKRVVQALIVLTFLLWTIQGASAALTDGLEIYLNLTGTLNDSVRTGGQNYTVTGTPTFKTANIGTWTGSSLCLNGGTQVISITNTTRVNLIKRNGTQSATECVWFNTTDVTNNDVVWSHHKQTATTYTNGFYVRRTAGAAAPEAQYWGTSETKAFPHGGGAHQGFQLYCVVLNATSGQTWINTTAGLDTTTNIGVTDPLMIELGALTTGANNINSGCYVGFAAWNRSLSLADLITLWNNGTYFDIVSNASGGGGGGGDNGLNATISLIDSFDFTPVINGSRIRIYNATLQLEKNLTIGSNTAIFENATNQSWSINISSLEYYNRSFTNFFLNNSNLIGIYQSVVTFNISSAVFHNPIVNATATVNTTITQVTNLTMPIKAGIINVTLWQNATHNFQNRTFRVTINATTTVVLNEIMYEVVPNLNVTFTLNDSFDGTAVNNFTTIRIYNSTFITEVNTTTARVIIENATNQSWTVNITTIDYITQSLPAQSLSINISYSLYQAVITWNISTGIFHEIIDDAIATVSTNLKARTNITMPVKAGLLNVTLWENSSLTYYNHTFQLVINKTTTPVLNEVMWASLANISQAYACNITYNFTLLNTSGAYFPFNDIFTTDNHTINEYLMPGDYLIIYDGASCSIQHREENHTILLHDNQWNLTLFQINTLNISFMEEVTDQNFAKDGSAWLGFVEAISTVQSINLTFQESPGIGLFTSASLLTPGDYSIRYWVCVRGFGMTCNNDPMFLGWYPARMYYLNLTNGSVYSLNLYLGTCNSSELNMTFTSYNQLRNTVNDVVIKVNRYSTVSQQYELVGMMKSNLDGQSTFRCIYPNSDYYKFVLERNGTTKLITYPSQMYSSTMEFIIQEGINLATDFFRSNTIDHRLYYDSNAFTFTYNDVNNVAQGGCLYVYRTNGVTDTLYNVSCKNGVTGTAIVAVAEMNGTTYKALAGINFTDRPALYNVETLWHEYVGLNPLGNIVPFMVAFMTLMFAAIGFWSPFVALTLAPIPTVLTSYVGVLPLPFSAAISIWVMCIILAVFVERM